MTEELSKHVFKKCRSYFLKLKFICEYTSKSTGEHDNSYLKTVQVSLILTRNCAEENFRKFPKKLKLSHCETAYFFKLKGIIHLGLRWNETRCKLNFPILNFRSTYPVEIKM